MPDSGKLIALEGPDEALLDRLAEEICGWLGELSVPIDRTREPTGGPMGAQIWLHRQGRIAFTPECLALLMVADRLDHLEKEKGVLSLLAGGRHVLCVHYVLTSYEGLYDQVPLDWHRLINARCRVPDLTLYVASEPPADDLAAAIDGTVAWVDAAQDEQGVARRCRELLSGLLALGGL